ncbi:hypothetical protein GYMLUDRAFT_245027 [Collybiopsis luxurians FD-317 M1]|uniref:Uncharacterized protein n=1 Tax=Collybiopsis luxurians FD-317 M1 TaxID=944289 RepID=A0A0D0CV41_9AGAR|nr:hypothetical protein GYMLUDRAFT_245027 [Collybiopsis luxurians FD-317 M1]
MHPILPISWPQPSNSVTLDAPPRLLKSPFQLASSSQIIETPSGNSSNRASQRRRHCSRSDCPVQSSSSSSTHSFDKLSWISAMDLSSVDYGLTDIADLSQLPIPVDDATSGPGPVRRRKTSLHRTSPLRAASGSSTQSTHPLSVLRHRQIPTPSSPQPRIARSRIIFHDLMPLFTCDTHKYRSSTPSSPAY